MSQIFPIDMTTPAIVLLGVCVLAVLLVISVGAYLALVAPAQQSAARAVNIRLDRMASDMNAFAEGRHAASQVLRQEVVSESLLDQYFQHTTLAKRLTFFLGKAGMSWTAGHFVGLLAGGGLMGLTVGLLFNPLVSVITTICGVMLPLFVVMKSGTGRIQKIETQLPEAVDMLVNSLRAGYSLQAAMQFVGQEVSAPLGPEFLRLYDEQRLGMDMREALQGLADRLNTADGRMLVLAVLIQRETGGNLSEILGTIASVIRERITFRNNLDVLTAESKMSAIVLSLLPVVIYGAISVFNPDYLVPLTATDGGKTALIYAAVSLCIGFLLMKKMSRIEV